MVKKKRKKSIEKELLTLDEWTIENLITIQERYNASMKEIVEVMSNVKSFNKYVK
jgi:hypothetical protein